MINIDKEFRLMSLQIECINKTLFNPEWSDC